MFDVEKIRQDFAMIRNTPDLIYFDNGATTYKPDSVIKAVNDYYSFYNSNVSRGEYTTAVKADQAYNNTRKVISKLINSEINEVSFLGNITACLNQIAFGLSRNYLKKGDKVLLSYGEHASNLLPWYRLQKDIGIEIEYIPLDIQGNIDIEQFEKLFDQNIRLVSIAYVGNVLGNIQPIKKICEITHKNNALLVVDAAQAIGHLKIDVKDLDVDFLCFSAHKMLGPDGVGVLYGKYELLKDMEPLLLGGGMNARFDKEGNVIYKDGPERFEAGTPNIEGVIGLAKASEYLMDVGLDNIHEYEIELKKYMIEKMNKLDNVKIYNPDNISSTVSFNINDIFAQDVATYLSTKNIAVRSGNHCAKILHNLIGTDQSIRASLYLYNTKEEIDYFVDIVGKTTLVDTINVFL